MAFGACRFDDRKLFTLNVERAVLFGVLNGVCVMFDKVPLCCKQPEHGQMARIFAAGRLGAALETPHDVE